MFSTVYLSFQIAVEVLLMAGIIFYFNSKNIVQGSCKISFLRKDNLLEDLLDKKIIN